MLALMLPADALIFTFIHMPHIQEENEIGVEQNAEETEGAELFRQDVREASFKEHQTLLSAPRELEDLVSLFLFSKFSHSYKSPLGRPC